MSRDGEGEPGKGFQLPFAFTTPLVKMRLERSAERDKREMINHSSADDAQSKAERIFKSSS